MSQKTKFCKHCGEVIDSDCVVCPKCGKQVETLDFGRDIIINNSASAAASAASSTASSPMCKMPWYLSWFWIIVFGFFTGGIYFIVGLIMRVNWKSHN